MTAAVYEICLRNHTAVGTIGYPAPLPKGYTGPHASVRTCGAAACVASANRYILSVTGHRGVFRTFSQARAENAQAAAS
jgi:hypothetical protein